ncbi:LacI family DNA-binding transcriptional regulator [Nitratireductor sp. CAU 1489]|uniref:LacI family DNA-binding transcriptional regulator n=1 Tax=Nitratireductor arenosus TaxID=2682096 RepID=A0A844QDT8_9HYPH|nr:LacI family DNA-binding transcriptional regulator [Nitratireductor arenosus]MVA96258.1 LacI family DNA-binding transcriptional regulator [Nitratireductor arenosus]
MSKKKLTMKEIAAAVDVSVMTVSNVINGRDHLVGEETKRRVKAAIDELGYRPSATARALRSSRMFSIGFIVLYDERKFLGDPFIAALADGLCAQLAEQGYSLTIQGVFTDELSEAKAFRRMETDGLCLLLSGSQPTKYNLRELLKSLRQPIVLFQEGVQRAEPDICSIRQDDRGGGRLLAEHVVSRGARSVLVVVPQVEWPAISERVGGVREALHARPGVEMRVLVSESEKDADVQAALTNYLDQGGKPDAILAANDQMAIAAHTVLEQRGLTLPDQIMLTGFNRFNFWRYFSPKVTTVISPAEQLGRTAATALTRRIDDGEFEDRDIVLPVELVQGQTT